MPKIIIKEYDKTKPGSTEYVNFSVVVPGYVETGKGVECFDENGIYECSNQSDFEENVGKVQYIGKGAGPTLENLGTEEAPVYYKVLTADEFAAHTTATENCYTKAIDPTATDEGVLIKKEGEVYYKYTLVTEWAEGTSYSAIKNDKRGTDRQPSIGNQIAYELLGLGYTVLYKKMDEVTPWGPEGGEKKKGIEALGVAEFWEALKDKSVYDFRYVMTGCLTDKGIEQIIALASYNNKATDGNGRGDCIALVDVPEVNYGGNKTQAENIKGIKTYIEGEVKADKYTAFFAPYVEYVFNNTYIADKYQNTKFPAAFHYLACAAKSLESFAEWYAIAGYTRGVNRYSVAGIGCKLGEAAVDALQPRQSSGNFKKAVNIVIKNKDNYYLWGNRTAHQLEADSDLVASHFLNIRQLCCTLKKQVYSACRKFTFDPNSDILWINFCNAITPTLEKMKADQGIRAYEIIKVQTSQKAFLKAKIRIVPIEAVEDFEIGISLEDSIGGSVEFTD